MNIAIITGASSGLGVEFFKEMQKEPLDEVWVIARREKALIDVCEQYGSIKYRVIAMDLTLDDSIEKISNLLDEENPTIKFLFNNAGFGVWGKFEDTEMQRHCDMIDLNIKALTKMTSVCLKHMNQGSRIINVSSIVSYMPVAKFSSYSASKAYVLSFSRALRQELKKQKINVTAICPGPMATDFFTLSGLKDGESKSIEHLPKCNPTKTAKKGIRAAKKGRAVYTPRLFYKFCRVLAKTVPHSILMKLQNNVNFIFY